MGDLNNNSNVGTWPVYFGNKPSSNGQFNDPQFQRRIADDYFGYHTETVSQKMLEHEAIFQTQLYELHRLYKIQKDLMDDLKMNELQKQSMDIETLLSSCSASQRPDDQRKLTSLPFPLSSSSSAQLGVAGSKDIHSFPDFFNGRHPQSGLVSPRNIGRSKDCEVDILDCRPSTARRKFDLELQADEYIDVEEPKYRTDKPPFNSTKIILSQSINIDSRWDEARRNNGGNGLADLKQQTPSQGLDSSPFTLVGCNSNFRSNQQICSKSQLQTAPCDNSHFLDNSSSSRNLTNPGSGVKSDYQNGLYKDSCSASGPAHCPTIGYDYLNHRNISYMASCTSVCQNGSVKFKGLTCIDSSSTKGIDLNITSVADEHDYDDRLSEDQVAHFPWEKSSTGLKKMNGTAQPSYGCVMRQNSGPSFSVYEMAMKATTAKTIMGVPMLGDSSLSNGPLSCRSLLPREEKMEKNGRVCSFDINLPCEYDENDTEAPVVSRRNLIDLNMCLADDDTVMEIPMPCSHHGKTIRGFDLEAYGDIEEEEMIQPKLQKSERLDESLVSAVAEAIVGVSTCRKLAFADTSRNSAEETPHDTLKWFVDIVSSCPDDDVKVSSDEGDRKSDSLDYFECMTLKSAETKEEDYLPKYPKPPEPEEETGTALYTTRTRKGQTRRGRPRRDFQRDILPGLTSLARHEVTEDLQTFGGLMRATGQTWQSSLTRRAGPRRGRPRLTPVQPHIPVPFCSPSPQKRKTTTLKEVVTMEEDHGNLTGWGKTTRRPRRQPTRQRCSTASVVQQIT